MKFSNLISFIFGFCLFAVFICIAAYDGADSLIILLVHSLDFPSLFCVLGITLMILAASGKINSVKKALSYSIKKVEISSSMKDECRSAIKCTTECIIISGFIGSIIYAIILSIFNTDLEEFIYKIFLIFLPLLYSFIFCAILLPIKYHFNK